EPVQPELRQAPRSEVDDRVHVGVTRGRCPSNGEPTGGAETLRRRRSDRKPPPHRVTSGQPSCRARVPDGRVRPVSAAEGRASLVSSADLKQVKEELVKAGVEIYRTRPPAEIQVAERVRLHIMDSGVRVRVDPDLTVVFTARTQRSDFPSVAPDELFAKVRERVGQLAVERGYEEQSAQTV